MQARLLADSHQVHQTREKASIVFRWEVFNVFNWPNLPIPRAIVSSPSTFGKINCDERLNSRIMQFGLKVEF